MATVSFMPPGPLWAEMDAQPRRSMATLVCDDIPESPGVYALYRGGDAMYVGKADSLRQRVWSNHLGRGIVMTSSAMRRNVAELLGIASAADIKARRYRSTGDDARRVQLWLSACEMTWLECPTAQAAQDLETAMKEEYKPLLTKR